MATRLELARRIASTRNAKARSYEAKLSKALRALINDTWDVAADRVAQGLVPLTERTKDALALALLRAERPYALVMAADSYEEAVGVLENIESRRAPRPPKPPRILEDDPFLLRGHAADVEDYLLRTSASEAQHAAARIDKEYRKALATPIDPETHLGITTAQIAKRLEEIGAVFSKQRANMISRTMTVWSYNEGAAAQYKDFGIEGVQWMATEDDLTCEFCLALAGDVQEIGGAFAGPGELQGIGDGGLRIPDRIGNIEHPPLHPNCRCVLLPVVDQGMAQEVSDDMDRAREAWHIENDVEDEE